ncbi:MAG: transposase [Deltaproteobacteria bacterium]|nr:transposase [Deltaproteobacteria bacterium]
MPRCARLDAPGTVHHVIIRGIEKREIVNGDADRGDFVSRMSQIAEKTQTKIYAWALMTNHAHMLVRSGTAGLAQYMRRLLTGYAGYYNRQQGRHGHLFQNRYKSIVCDEDVYMKELVRYIHLNPLRAGLVRDMEALDSYPWSGHHYIMGGKAVAAQDRDFVLSCFGRKAGVAKRAYRRYVGEGITQGHRPELVGGGLLRSLGGWSEVLSVRKQGGRLLSDERILGSGDFVNQVLREAESMIRRQYSALERKKIAEAVIGEACREEEIAVSELQHGSRRPVVARVRKQIIATLFDRYGIPQAEIARHTGVSTSAVSKTLSRRE